MSNIRVLNYKNVKRNKYHYNLAKKTNYNSYISSCVYKLSNSEYIPFLFESPRLKTTSGIYKSDGNFYIDLEIPLESTNNEKTFYDFLTENDEIDIISSYNNCKEWFNNSLPMDIIKNYYKSSIILQGDGKNPILKVRIPSYRGKVMIEIYNQDKELVSNEFIEVGDDVICLLEKVGLEFLSKQFISEYQVHKIKVFKMNYVPEVKVPSGYLFSDKTYINMNQLPDKKPIINNGNESQIIEEDISSEINQVPKPEQEPEEPQSEEPEKPEEPQSEEPEEPEKPEEPEEPEEPEKPEEPEEPEPEPQSEEPEPEPQSEEPEQEQESVINSQDIVSDIGIIPDDNSILEEIMNDFENESDNNEDNEYYSDSEYEIDDDLENSNIKVIKL